MSDRTFFSHILLSKLSFFWTAFQSRQHFVYIKELLVQRTKLKKKLSSPFSHSLGFFREKLLLITLAMHEKLFKMYDTRRRRRPMKSSATLYTKITVVAKTFLPSFRETPGWLSISDGFGHLRPAHAQCPRYMPTHYITDLDNPLWVVRVDWEIANSLIINRELGSVSNSCLSVYTVTQ